MNINIGNLKDSVSKLVNWRFSNQNRTIKPICIDRIPIPVVMTINRFSTNTSSKISLRKIIRNL